MSEEFWLHIHYTESVKDKIRAREILPERFVLLESSLISLEYDLIPKGTIMHAKSIDTENYIVPDNYFDILQDATNYTYVYEILTDTIPLIFDFEKMIAPALQEHHFSYEIKHGKYLLIHTTEENYPTINSIFEKLNYFPKEIDMYDFGAKKYETSKPTIWQRIKKPIYNYGKWVFMPVFSLIILGKCINHINIIFSINKILDILLLAFEVSTISTFGCFLFIEIGSLLEQLFQKKYASSAYLAKVAKNRRFKAFANKHKFLFFRDCWRGYYKDFLTEIKIDYNVKTYQTEYYLQVPVSEHLYYDLENLQKEYRFYHELNYVVIYKYEPFLFFYPKTEEIEIHLDEMITQVKNIQVIY